MTTNPEVNILAVENNHGDRLRLQSVYVGNREELAELHGLTLPERLHCEDNAVSGKEHIGAALQEGRPIQIMFIDRDLKYLEVPVLLGEAGTGEYLEDRVDSAEEISGVRFLSNYMNTTNSSSQTDPLVIAAFYTAEPELVYEDPLFKSSIIPQTEAGVGPVVFVQRKGSDPVNEIANLFDAVFTAYKMAALDKTTGEPVSEGDLTLHRMQMGTEVKAMHYEPNIFLDRYSS